VLQHIADVETAVAEFARVTRAGGRVLAVEPDNRARYSYAATPAGVRAFETSARFFAALASARGEKTDAAIGPKLPGLFASHEIEPLNVRLFPVSQTRVGAPPADVWTRRQEAIERMLQEAPNDSVRTVGREYLDVLQTYAAEAAKAGPGFVEIQNTMLFATVGQKT
jgi:ubiquinone/menaquinone biosynthesis C-methylase UbiE